MFLEKKKFKGITKKEKQHKNPLADEWINRSGIAMQGTLSASKKEWNTVTCYNMDDVVGMMLRDYML